MALYKNMQLDDITSFINGELIPQTEREIKNLIEPRKKQGGYFVVTRQIFCMLDFLGAVYAGYPKSERLQDVDGRKISTSRKTIKFMKAFFKPRTVYTTNKISMLHSMYRNGLVHLYQPKALRFRGGRLDWFIYKGKNHLKQLKVNTNKGIYVFNDVHHLKIINFSRKYKRYYLAICINELYKDFIKAVKLYESKLKLKTYIQGNWRTTVNAICEPR
ncbi:hypothetical protein B6D29_02275 [Microgenomates bacterium UTCPR1]|nr:MAG: hypothetical protein B6D29_02275 [Microgenomates bacterium UTCPR1]